MTFATGSYPVSVALGDFNNDGGLDIFVANWHSDSVSLLLGYGNGSFGTQTMYSAGSDPQSVAVGDFNNDHRQDMIVANGGSNSVSVLLRYDGGALGNENTFTSADGSRLQSVAFGDFNNDSRLDIVVANYGSKNVGILLGYENGTFGNQTMLLNNLNSLPFSVAVGDFNDDSQLDIVVTNYGTNNIVLIFGNGNGTFVPQISNDIGSNLVPLVVVVGDFNNDRRPEIVAAYNDADNVVILMVHDTGYFAQQTKYSTDSNPASVAVGDFNNDGRLDIIVANNGGYTVGVFLGDGNGSFAEQTSYPTGDYSGPKSVAVGDFNNDSRLDIVVANNGSYTVGVFLGDGNGAFAEQTTYPTGDYSGPISVAVGDFNNDDRLDIIVANNGDDTVGVFLGDGNGAFAEQTSYPTGYSSYPISVAVGDFNNDDRLDIIVANNGDDTVGVFLGDGNGAFAEQITYPTGNYSGPISVAVGDFNNDSQLDIVVANSYSNNVGIFLGHGNGSFGEQTTYPTGQNSVPYSVAVGDFNNDSLLDIVVANDNTHNVGVFLGYGNGSFESQMTFPTGADPCSVAIGDFNNDNRLDIVATNFGRHYIGVFLGYVNKGFLIKTVLVTGDGSRPRSIAVGDFNNDKQLDIAVANSGTKSIGIFLGYGNYNFSNQSTYSTDSLPQCVAVGDFNNDARWDIVVANSLSNNISVLLGYGDGSFANQTTYATGSGSFPISVAVGDFNNDTLLDIAVANRGGSFVGIFLGHGNGTFGSLIEFPIAYGSLPFSVIVDDFNSDNKLDFAVANYGTDNLEIFLRRC